MLTGSVAIAQLRLNLALRVLLISAAAAVLAVAAPVASAGSVQVSQALSRAKDCPGVRAPHAQKTRVSVLALKGRLPSCSTAKRIMRKAVKHKGKRRIKGFRCKTVATHGFGSVVVDCRSHRVTIDLYDMTLDIEHEYAWSHERIQYDFGDEVKYLAQRLCSFSSQGGGDVTEGKQEALSEYYWHLTSEWKSAGGPVSPSPQEAEGCKPTPDDSGLYPSAYKAELVSTGGGARDIARDPNDRTTEKGRAAYGMYHFLFDRRRSQLPADVQGKVVTFGEYQRRMRTPYVDEIRESG